MMKILIEVLKGIVIGIANIIPGFSGGTMSIILGVYERILNALANFFKTPIKVIKDIWAIAIGLIIGIILSLFIIVKLLDTFPVVTVLFFSGLIIGTIPQIYTKINENGNHSIIDYLLVIIAIVIVVIIPFLNGNEVETTINSYTYPIMMVLGIISAAAMVIPGVSGSMLLMSFGYYFFIMTTITDFISQILSLNFVNMLPQLFVLLCFAIGCILGVVFISKLILKLLRIYPRKVYCTIMGLLIASPFVIAISVIDTYADKVYATGIVEIIIAVIFLALGAFISGYLPIYLNKKKIS